MNIYIEDKENYLIEDNDNILDIKGYVILINRISKVVKGGKNIKYKVTAISGDYNNNVGIGIGYDEEFDIAKENAYIRSQNNFIEIPQTNNKSIKYNIEISYKSCKLILNTAKSGTGLIANNIVKVIFELAGIKNLVAKTYGSRNCLNIIKTTFLAIKFLKKKIKLKNNINNI